MSGSTVNAQIPLQFQPTPNVGPNIGKAADDANALMRLNQGDQEARRLDALRMILGRPGAIDAMGQPTGNTMQQVMSVDPNVGLKLQQNAMVNQEHAIRTRALQSKTVADQMDQINDAYTSVQSTYDEAVSKGTPPAKALRDAQEGLADANQRLSQILPSDVMQRAMTQYDPIKMRNMLGGVRSYLDTRKLQNQERHQTTEENIQRERIDAASKAGQWTPGYGKDEGGTQVPGMYFTPKTGGDPVFHPGVVAAPKGGGGVGTQDRAATEGIEREKYEKELGHPIKAQEEVNELSRRVMAASDKRRADQAGSTAAARDASKHIPDEVSRNIAEQYVESGNPMVLAGFRRSPAMIAQIEGDILKVQKEKNMTPQQVARQSAEFAAFQQGIKAFEAGGKLEPVVRSLSVGTGHLGVLGDAALALKNGDMRAFNQLSQWISKSTGHAAPTDFDGVKRIVALELFKAVSGTAGALGDREAIQGDLDRANSQTELISLIQKYKSLMGGQLSGLRATYERLGTNKDFDERFLSPEARKELRTTTPKAGDAEKATPNRLDRATPQKQTWPTPDDEAKELLRQRRSNPNEAALFEKTFGPGSAERALGGDKGAPPPSNAPVQIPPAAPARPQNLLPLNPGMKKSDLVKDGVYDTAKGPARWDGEKFYPVGQ